MEIDKKLIIKLIEGNKVTEEDLNLFLSEYIKEEKGKYPTDKELRIINQLVKAGQFNLEKGIDKYIEKFNLQVVHIQDLSTGKILKTNVNE